MPLPLSSTTSGWWPKTSAMSLRIRRAAAPVSSSASTTMPPLTRWRASANRSIEETSAFRQQVFVTCGAGQFCLYLCRHRHVVTLVRIEQPRISGAKFLRIMDTGLDRGEVRRSPDGLRRPRRWPASRSPSWTAEGSTRTAWTCEVGGVPEEHVEVVGEVVAPGLVGVRLEVHRDDHLARRTAQGVAQVGHEQVRDDAGVPGARAQDDPVGLADGRDRLGARLGVGGLEGDREHLARPWSRPRPGRGRWTTSSGSSPAPRTSAVMSSGVSAIGSTRPRAPSSPATQSRPSTWSCSSSHSVTMSRLPIEWPSISPSEANRCWSTRAQVCPQRSSPHRALPAPSAGRREAARRTRRAAARRTRRCRRP